MKLSIFILSLVVLIYSESLKSHGKKRKQHEDTSLIQKHKIKRNEEASSVRKGFLYNKQQESIKFLAVGDIMLSRNVEEKIKEVGGNNYEFPLQHIQPYLSSADLLFGNLEAMFSNKNESKGVQKKVYFKAKAEAIRTLLYGQFNIVSVANNHALDYGRTVFENSLHILKENDIQYVGGGSTYKEAQTLKVMILKDTRIGFMAYNKYNKTYQKEWTSSHNRSGINILPKKEEIDKILQLISKNKKKVDLLFISLHWGLEYKANFTSYQEQLAQRFIDSGADLIIGHHSHVVAPLRQYKGKWIAYSLGNFVFDQDWCQECMKGGVLEVEISMKKVIRVMLRQVKINENYQVLLSV